MRNAPMCLLLSSLALALLGCGGDNDAGPAEASSDESVLEVSSDFDQVVVERSSEKPVAVLFTAPWSGPDRVFKPIVSEVMQDRSDEFGLVFVDVDQYPGIANKFEVLSIPTLAVFQGGRPVDRLVGAQPQQKLNDFLDSTLQGEATSG